MKTLFKNTTILTILLATITSCNDIKDIANIEKDVVLTENFTVDLEGEPDSIASENIEISIITTEIEPYEDLLKNVEIQRITFEVINYSGNDQVQFEVEFRADGTLFMNESFVASEADTNNTIFEASNTEALNSLATKLLNNKTVTVSFKAESTNLENPANFDVETKFYIVVTANPL